MKLNVCGNEVREGGKDSPLLEGFINIDARPLPKVDLVWDITNGLPFENESIEEIRCSHTLEHFKYDDILRILAEFRRILQYNGVLRIYVPDFDKVNRDLEDNKLTMREASYYLLGGQRNEYDLHRYLFTNMELVRIVESAGFIIDGNKPRPNAYRYDLGIQAHKGLAGTELK